MARSIITNLLCLAAFALASCASTGPRAANVRLSVEAPSSLPARFASKLVIVDVALDGRGVFPFLLDTGSDVTVIDRRLNSRFQFKTESDAIARGSGGSVKTSFIRAASMEIGPIHIESPVLLVLDLSSFDPIVGAQIGGIVGLDALEGLALKINYPARKVEIAQSGGFVDLGVPRIPLVRRDNLYGINVNLGCEEPVSLLLDTGMSGCLSLEIEQAYSCGLRPDPMRRGEWRVGIGGSGRSPVTTAPWVNVGDRDIPRVELVLEKPAGRFAGAIGGGLLRFFTLTIDFGAQTIQLSNEPCCEAVLSQGNTTGARLDYRYDFAREGIRIDCVKAGTPAAECGVRSGDMLIEINGEPVSKINSRRMRDLASKDAKSLTWTILTPAGPEQKVLRKTLEAAPAGPK